MVCRREWGAYSATERSFRNSSIVLFVFAVFVTCFLVVVPDSAALGRPTWFPVGATSDSEDGELKVKRSLEGSSKTPPKPDGDSPDSKQGSGRATDPPPFIDNWVNSTAEKACSTDDGQYCGLAMNVCGIAGTAVENSSLAADYSVAPTVQTGTRIDTSSGDPTNLGSRCHSTRNAAPGGGGPGAAPVVITVSREDFASLPVAAPTAKAGPPDGWVPVNLDVVMYAEGSESQNLTTDILGAQVRIQATPVSYSWDLGDGTVIESDEPGRPYPHKDVTGSYTHEGWYDVTLTTTYAGQFSVDGGPWQTIDGTIDVESEPVPIYSKSLESRLVDGDKPVDENGDPWVPERTKDTEGPKSLKARDDDD